MSVPTVKFQILSDRHVENLLRRLNGADRVMCQEAAEELIALPTEQIAEVIEYNNGITDPGKAIIELVVGLLVSVLMVFALLVNVLPLAGGLLLALGALFGGYLLRFILRTIRSRRTHCRGLSKVIEPILGHLDGVSAVPIMADALFDKGESAHALARAVLIRQLPRLRPGNAALLAPSQQRRLNDILRGNDADLMIAILQAYAQVGGASTLGPVGHLARSATDPRVRDAAIQCLPPLRARLAAAEEREKQTQISKTLLRGSAPAATEPSALLRAAVPTHQETAPEQLLRAQSE